MLPDSWRRRLACFLMPVFKISSHCIWPNLSNLNENPASVSETVVLFWLSEKRLLTYKSLVRYSIGKRYSITFLPVAIWFFFVCELFAYSTTPYKLHSWYRIEFCRKVVMNGEYVRICKEAEVACLSRDIRQDNNPGNVTCNVTLRRVREPLLQWKSNKYYIFWVFVATDDSMAHAVRVQLSSVFPHISRTARF